MEGEDEIKLIGGAVDGRHETDVNEEKINKRIKIGQH